MVRIVFAVTLGVIACVSSGYAASQSSLLQRPRGQFSATILGFEYDPSPACPRPRKPFDVEDRFEREQYLTAAKRYLTCLDEAARNDANVANAVVQQGLEDAMEDFMREVRRDF